MRDFHAARRSPRSSARRRRRSRSPSRCPTRSREAFRFKPGQHLTLRAEHRRRGAAAHLLDLLRARRRRAAHRHQAASPAGASRAGPTRRSGRATTLEVMPPMGRFGVAPERDGGAAPIVGLRRRRRHHADPVDREARAGARAGDQLHAVLRQPHHREHHVPRGAGGPEGPLRRAPVGVPHAVARGAGRRRSSTAASTPRRSTRCCAHVVPAERGRPRLRLRPERHDRGRRGGARTLGLRAEQIHLERFTPAERRRRAAGAAAAHRRRDARTAVAEIILDGVRHPFPVAGRRAIVDAALRAGTRPALFLPGRHVLHLPGQDRRGRGRDDPNYSLEPWEIAAGFALTCQSLPKTARVVVDYDHF